MKIIRDIEAGLKLQRPVVTVGSFDGLHRGHHKVLQLLCDRAQSVDGQSVVVTFDPHPRLFLNKGKIKLELLTSIEEKVDLFEKVGIDYLVILKFDAALAATSYEDFLQKYLLDGLGMHRLLVGYDHGFGKNRQGNFARLVRMSKQIGFEVEEVDEEKYDIQAVSSSRIRVLIKEGNIEHANELLGYHFRLQGTVVHGNQVGKVMGFPTANLKVADEHKLIPSRGVYAVLVQHNDRSFKGMCNIGVRPTLEGKVMTIEVNIFNFDEDIYDESLTIRFVERLRDETRFDNLSLLVQQLNHDRDHAVKRLQIY